jgi:hypothetical protein
MAKTKNTPAYVKKAIEWLENNAPEGEQIAFINEEEAAHLKAMGGSGQEVVEGVRSYDNGGGNQPVNQFGNPVGTDIREFSVADQLRITGRVPIEDTGGQQAVTDRLRALTNRQRRGLNLPEFTTEQFDAIPGSRAFNAAQQVQQQEQALSETQFAPRVGGSAAIRAAEQTTPSELAIPTVPAAPAMQVAQIGAPAEQQLISEQGLQVAAAPTAGAAQTVQDTGLAPTVPARVPAATTTAAQVADTGPATAAQLAAPTRTIGDIQEAIPTEELAVAATGELDPRATLQFQLGEITSSIKEGQPLPLWAAPAARNADSIMLQRGLGASSMAASARTQALLEAGLPIASADAASYGRIQLQNLSHRQATALQNSNNLAAMRTQNLNARLSAAVNNAQNFLAVDTANLTNRQASNVLSFQADQQRLFSNQAAENAASQFNATTSNQVEQFFSTLENSVSQANANRLTAIRQFNVGETNAQNQFLENQRLSRETFNSQVQSSVRAANSNWFKSIATIENANQMLANSFAAQSALALSNLEYQSLWQKRRDDASFIFNSVENDLTRNVQLAIASQNASISRSANNAASRNSIFGTIGSVVGAALPAIIASSDIRLKTNIEKIGEFSPVIDLYRWEWNEVAEKLGVDNQPTVGVLAQELIEYRPDLVLMADDGYFRVNYSGLLS